LAKVKSLKKFEKDEQNLTLKLVDGKDEPEIVAMNDATKAMI